MLAQQIAARAAECVQQYFDYVRPYGSARPVLAHLSFQDGGDPGDRIGFIASPHSYAADGAIVAADLRPEVFDAATVGRIHELCHVAATRPVELYKLNGLNDALNTDDVHPDAVQITAVELEVGVLIPAGSSGWPCGAPAP